MNKLTSRAVKFSLSKVNLTKTSFLRMSASSFADKMKDKENAEEKFFFDKEESRKF